MLGKARARGRLGRRGFGRCTFVDVADDGALVQVGSGLVEVDGETLTGEGHFFFSGLVWPAMPVCLAVKVLDVG